MYAPIDFLVLLFLKKNAEHVCIYDSVFNMNDKRTINRLA